jgi:hypothetical protein
LLCYKVLQSMFSSALKGYIAPCSYFCDTILPSRQGLNDRRSIEKNCLTNLKVALGHSFIV